jgi:hypothetical protein
MNEFRIVSTIGIKEKTATTDAMIKNIVIEILYVILDRVIV